MAAASSTERLADLAVRSSREPAAVLAEARSWIGTPYHHQASVKGVGCDCLGLVRGVWRAFHGPEPESLPGYSSDWGEVSGEETMLFAARRHLTEVEADEARPGDVLVFRIRRGRVAKHTGILATLDTFIHAQEGGPVCEAALSDWWRARIAAVFRFPGVVLVAGELSAKRTEGAAPSTTLRAVSLPRFAGEDR